MKKRLLSLLLCVVMVIGMLPMTALGTEATSGSNKIALLYDDYATENDLGFNPETATLNQGDTQLFTKVDGEEDTTFAATSVGTATYSYDGNRYEVTVSPAPISLIMITGHSIAQGSKGNAKDSIVCERGKAYSSHMKVNEPAFENVTGIGYGAEVKPAKIDALTKGGGGLQGIDSAFAYQWLNDHPNEKVWVINAGVGGKSLVTWQKGGTEYNNAIKLFKAAEGVLKKELDAGHYALSHMAVINHSAANADATWESKKYADTFIGMWNGMKTELSYDFGGSTGTRTVEAIGVVPLWNYCSTMNEWDEPKSNPLAMTPAKLVNYCLAGRNEYPDVFLAESISRNWLTDAGVNQYFTNYNAHTTHKGTVETKPETIRTVFNDGVHYEQVGYNALGIEIAKNLSKFLDADTQPKSSTVRLLAEGGNGTSVPSFLTLDVGESYSFAPLSTPAYTGALSLECDNSQICSISEYPVWSVTALAEGTATVKVLSEGKAVASFDVKVRDDAINWYFWNFEDESGKTDSSVGNDNQIKEATHGSYTITNDTLTADSLAAELTTPINLSKDSDWAVEIKGCINGGRILLSNNSLNSQGDVSIWIANTGNALLCVKGEGKIYTWYMISNEKFQKLDFDSTLSHTFRLQKKGSVINYYLDGELVGALDHNSSGSTNTKDITAGSPAGDLLGVRISWLGNKLNTKGAQGWRMTGTFNTMKFWEDSSTITFDVNASGLDAIDAKTAYAGETITLPDAPTRADYTFNGWFDGRTIYQANASYTVPAIGNITMTAQWGNTCSHEWHDEWNKNEYGHWHDCRNCDEQKDFDLHTLGEAATEQAAQTCTECGYEIASKLIHAPMLVEGYEATTTAPGKKDYYHCDSCGRNYADETSEHEIIGDINEWRYIPKITENNGSSNNGFGGGRAIAPASFSIAADNTDNGSISVSPKSASKGTTVTITATPDKGYKLDKLTATDSGNKQIKLTEKDGKYTFEMPASNVTVKASFTRLTAVNPFIDVNVGDYFYEAVLWAVEKNITSGTSATTFSPNEPCTRAQIVTFLWRAAGSPEPKSAASFVDVNSDSYYAKAVAWAVENGITSGTGEGKFSPDDVCTRAQAVTFLSRALKGNAAGGTSFTDVDVNSYYAKAVEWAVNNGITNGTSEETFSPDADCTRGQIVTFLFRAIAN